NGLSGHWYDGVAADGAASATAAARTASEARRTAAPKYHGRVGLIPFPAVKVLLVSLYFPPAGGGGVQRPLKFATHLPALGIETHVLAPDDPRWVHADPELKPPTQAWVHRARYLGPRGRKPAEELYGRRGLERYSRQARSFSRRL